MAALAAFGIGCGGSHAASDAAQASDAPAGVQAGTAVATVQAFPQLVSAIGTVTPRPGRFAELAAPAPTRVARIFVALGQRVAEGDSLIEFERAPFDAAARSAETALENAQRAYARAVRLVQAGILPQKDADQAAADLAQAQVAAVTARRAQQPAVLGAKADQGQPLVEVAHPAALDIVFNVSPAEAARIHAGDAVTLSTGEGASGEALGQGAVMGVAATVDSISRAVAVRARLVRPSPTRSPRIGEAVFGRIVTGVHPRAVTVPVEALVPGGGDAFQVFVVDSGGIAHARPVTVGARTESLAEILTGLAAGETVVTAGAYGIQARAQIGRVAR